MTIFEALSVIGLILGPVSAVLITLWSQQRTDRKGRCLSLARNLLISQVDHADPSWSSNIRQIPVEFRGFPAVMDAWRSYIEAVNFRPSPENQLAHEAKFLGSKLDLLFHVAAAVDLGLSESDIRNSSYVAQAVTDRQKLSQDSDMALVRIAVALEKNGTVP